jgi:hypothetical protein
VKQALARALRLLALPTIVLVVVAVFASGRLEPAVRVYALVACAVVLGLAVAGLRRLYPGGARHGRRRMRPARPEPVRSLAQLENEAVLGIDDALDLHFRFRPHLRLIAAGLLEGRHGVVLDDEPSRARALLGDETWELLREDRPVPVDRRAPGLTVDALERVVLSLERLRTPGTRAHHSQGH